MLVENGVGTCLVPTASVSVQTCPHTTPSPSFTSALTQTEHPKPWKSSISNQNHPKLPTPDRFDWAEDSEKLPTTLTFPQHPPRDLSCLRSASAHPFSSLRRRRGHPKNRQTWNAQHSYGHSYSYSRHRSLHPHTPFPALLNWDRDPRLADLSNALHALGWVRW
jgi:hypothetical protein